MNSPSLHNTSAHAWLLHRPNSRCHNQQALDVVQLAKLMNPAVEMMQEPVHLYKAP